MCPGLEPHLEVQVQDVVLVEVVYALTDLLGEQDHIQFSQVALVIRDPVEELTPIHTARAKGEAGTRPSEALRRLVCLIIRGQQRVDSGGKGPLSLPPGVLLELFLWPIPSSECQCLQGSDGSKKKTGDCFGYG